jgi:hypothetical protein
MRRATTFATAAPSSFRTMCSARHDLVILDEEHVGVDGGCRKARGEAVGVHPVGGRSAPVEDARLGQCERPAADAEHPGTPRLRSADHLEIRLVDVVELMGRNRDQVRVGGGLETRVDHHVEPETGANRPGDRRGDREVEGWPTHVGAVDAEHLAHHAEFEGGDPGKGEQNDLLEHEASIRLAVMSRTQSSVPLAAGFYKT